MESTKKKLDTNSSSSLEPISKDELLDLKQTLEKKLSNHDYATLQSVLKILDFKQITLDLLKETLIGKTITSLTKIEAQNEDARDETEKVKQKADSLLAKWKKISQKEKSSAKGGEERKESVKPSSSQANGGKSSNHGSNNNHDSAHSSSQLTKIPKKESEPELYIPPGMKVNTGTSYRDNLRLNFIRSMQMPPEDSVVYEEIVLARAAELGLRIEDELFRQYPRISEYQSKARALVFNLKDPKNPDLRMSLIEAVIDPAQLVKLESKQLASKALQDERSKVQQANLSARRSDWFLENAAAKGNKGFFTCKKCHSKNTTYFQMQTRGADEPMTNFITCLDCKNQWKS